MPRVANGVGRDIRTIPCSSGGYIQNKLKKGSRKTNIGEETQKKEKKKKLKNFKKKTEVLLFHNYSIIYL